MAILISGLTSATFRQRGIEVAACALLGLLVNLAGCAAAPPLAQQPPAGMSASVPAPTISTGDSWTYRVRDGFTGLPRDDQRHEVTRAAAGRIEVAGNVERGDGSQVYDAEWNWLRRPATDLQTFEYSPAYQAYAFPLAPGKTWRSESIATDPRDGRRFPVKIEAKVLGWERVRVPAGEFDALKIQRIVTIGYWESMTRGSSYIKEYDWYAPSAKWAVKREAEAMYFSYTGMHAAADGGFVRVGGGGRDGGGPKYLRDDWFVYELAGFKVR
jgi:hypothetical protein